MLHSDTFYVSILIEFNCNIKCSVSHGCSVSLVYWLGGPYWVVDIQLHFSSSLFLHCFPCFIFCMLSNTFIKYGIKVWFTLFLIASLSSQEVLTHQNLCQLWEGTCTTVPFWTWEARTRAFYSELAFGV